MGWSEINNLLDIQSGHAKYNGLSKLKEQNKGSGQKGGKESYCCEWTKTL